MDLYVYLCYLSTYIFQWVQGHLMDNAQLLQQQQQIKQPPPLHSRVEGVKLLSDRNKGGLGVGGERSKYPHLLIELPTSLYWHSL